MTSSCVKDVAHCDELSPDSAVHLSLSLSASFSSLFWCWSVILQVDSVSALSSTLFPAVFSEKALNSHRGLRNSRQTQRHRDTQPFSNQYGNCSIQVCTPNFGPLAAFLSNWFRNRKVLVYCATPCIDGASLITMVPLKTSGNAGWMAREQPESSEAPRLCRVSGAGRDQRQSWKRANAGLTFIKSTETQLWINAHVAEWINELLFVNKTTSKGDYSLLRCPQEAKTVN